MKVPKREGEVTEKGKEREARQYEQIFNSDCDFITFQNCTYVPLTWYFEGMFIYARIYALLKQCKL